MGIGGEGDTFPANGTAVAIKQHEYGQQELDGSTADTTYHKKNYVYGVSGGTGSIIDDTTDTVPNSLAYLAQPADWPGSIAWPPAIDPSSPNVGNSVIPAQVFYNTGVWPLLVGNAPVVTITSPGSPPTITSGNAQTFTATATDTEDGTITSSIVWTSSIDGALGTGGSINPILSDGSHVILASVTPETQTATTPRTRLPLQW